MEVNCSQDAPRRLRYGFARTPLYATILTLLVSFVGLLGSLYAAEIRAAFPFYWHPGPVSWPALLFWSTLLGAAFMFFCRQQVVDEARRRSEEHLNQRADELTKLIRTLPPPDFLRFFREVYAKCNLGMTTVLETPIEQLTLEEVQEAIRLVLDSVATMAHQFDGRPRGVTYGANLMLYRPSESLSETEKTELRGRLKFCEAETDISALAGILDLDLELSTNTSSSALQPDPTLIPFALPVPKQSHSSDGKRWRALPGAPKAFCQKALDGYADTTTLGEWCRKEGDFSKSVIQELEQYFTNNEDPQVLSFVSLPLLRVTPQSEEGIGVLNIHRNTKGLLEEKEPVEHFVPLLGPFESILLRLLEILGNLKTSRRDTFEQ